MAPVPISVPPSFEFCKKETEAAISQAGAAGFLSPPAAGPYGSPVNDYSIAGLTFLF